MSDTTNVSIPGYLPGTWTADPAHTEISFTIRQMLISTVRGRFTGADITIVTGENPLRSMTGATIDAASIDTGNVKRNGHLRSKDYLDIEAFPTLSYRSTSVSRIGDGWRIDGELTVRGVTRDVPLTVELAGFRVDSHGERRAGFVATAVVNRRDFGLKIPMGSDWLVSKKATVRLSVDAIRQR